MQYTKRSRLTSRVEKYGMAHVCRYCKIPEDFILEFKSEINWICLKNNPNVMTNSLSEKTKLYIEMKSLAL